jgi:hypothetical protein
VRQIDISVSLVVVVCVVTSFRIRGIRHQTPNLGWRIHGSVEDTKLSTNKQHSLSYTPPRSEERKKTKKTFLIEHINHSYSRLEMSICNAQQTHMRVDVINL